jgi:hypothetical protein
LDLRLKLSAIVLVEMHSLGWLVVAVSTEGNDKTVLITRLVVCPEKYVMPFYPPLRAAYVAFSFFGYD